VKGKSAAASGSAAYGPDCAFAQKDPTVMDDLETEH
jgi:hypothetical protein